MPPRSPIIAFLAASPFELLDLTGPAAVFAYPTLKDKPYYSFRILSTASGDTVKSMGGLSIGDTCRFSEYAGPIDTLIVVGGLAPIGYQSPELLEWLRKRASRIRRIASVCTGAFILAASGLLDGRRVATHWRYCDLFVSRFRHLKVERDPIFIKDGKFYTTAGVSAVPETSRQPSAIQRATRSTRGGRRQAHAGSPRVGKIESYSQTGCEHAGKSRSHEPTYVRTPISITVWHHAGQVGPITKGRGRAATPGRRSYAP